MGVPAHDERDLNLLKYGLDIRGNFPDGQDLRLMI